MENRAGLGVGNAQEELSDTIENIIYRGVEIGAEVTEAPGLCWGSKDVICII